VRDFLHGLYAFCFFMLAVIAAVSGDYVEFLLCMIMLKLIDIVSILGGKQ